MKVILPIVIGFILAQFVIKGFNSYEWDYIAQEYYFTKWYQFQICKITEKISYDEYGKKRERIIRRPFKSYNLVYEHISAYRVNRLLDDIYSNLDATLTN